VALQGYPTRRCAVRKRTARRISMADASCRRPFVFHGMMCIIDSITRFCNDGCYVLFGYVEARDEKSTKCFPQINTNLAQVIPNITQQLITQGTTNS
jgi:hypothetical protein